MTVIMNYFWGAKENRTIRQISTSQSIVNPTRHLTSNYATTVSQNNKDIVTTHKNQNTVSTLHRTHILCYFTETEQQK